MRMCKIDINTISELQNRGIVTQACLDRALIVNMYYKLLSSGNSKELIYDTIARTYNKSIFTVRDIILKYLK